MPCVMDVSGHLRRGHLGLVPEDGGWTPQKMAVLVGNILNMNHWFLRVDTDDTGFTMDTLQRVCKSLLA